MSMESDLDDLSPKGTAVERALSKLDPSERHLWLGALDSGDYTSPDLAQILSRYSGDSVNGRQVRHYKEKMS